MPWHKQIPEKVDALFAANREADPLGRRVHTAFAAAACFMAGWPTTWVDWAVLPLAVCFAVRMVTHFRIIGPLFADPVAWLTLIWAAWLSLSTRWAPSAAGGFADQVGPLHFTLWVLMLWPVLDRRPVFIAALAAGIFCGQLSQVSQLLGTRFDLPVPTWNRFPDRNSGWWDPVVGGSILTAALGLHLGALLGPRNPAPSLLSSRFLLLASSFSLLTLLSIAATGTRGAWIASAMLVSFAAAFALWRRFTRPRPPSKTGPIESAEGASTEDESVPERRGRGKLIAAAALLVILLTSCIIFILPSVSKRAAEGVDEVRRAFEHDDYSTFTGQRLAMWKSAARAFVTHPIRGVGAGGFRPWMQAEFVAAAEPGKPIPPVHGHAHSWPIHTAATTGAVGLAILGLLVGLAVRSGLRAHRPTAGSSFLAAFFDRYTLGPPLALLGLTLAGLFDTIHVNQQTANLLFLLVALSLPRRPGAVA